MHARLCNGTAASLPWKLLRTYLESCANIVQSVVYRSPSCRPPSCWQKDFLKTVQMHASSWRGRRCSAAQASSDHPRWCRPHPVCLWVSLALGHGGHFIKNSISAIFWHGFHDALITCDMTHSHVTWLIPMWHDSFFCDMTHSHMTWLIYMWHESFTCDLTHSHVTWLINMWHETLTRDMTHSHVYWTEWCFNDFIMQ